MDLDEALALHALLRGHVEVLERHLQARDERIVALELELLRKQCELNRLKRAVFGHSSERVSPAELVLPGVSLAPSNDTTPEVPTRKAKVKAHERETKRRGRLELDPACVDDEHVHLWPDETTCACCGAELVCIGEETRTVVGRTPARYTRTITHRYKRACRACKHGGVHVPPAPEPSDSGAGTVGTSLAVDVAVMHFSDHLPFHRLVGIFRREGLSIDRSTLSRVAWRVANKLADLVLAMEEELLASDDVLGIDGTGIKIFASPHCLRRAVYVLHGKGHVVYRALRRETADHVLEGFKKFLGVLVCDAAKVHLGSVSQSYELRVALCNAHARRGFYDARATDRELANHALAFYQTVARHERDWTKLEPAARTLERQRELRPLFDKFHDWLFLHRVQLTSRSLMANPFDYVLRHWEGLTKFIDDGRIPWTNNESERHLRHVAVGRKAWVYRGSFEGAQSACVLWSLMMSCRIHGVEPRQYLLDVLAARGDMTARELLEWSPRNYAVRQRAAAAAAAAAAA